MMQSFGSGLVFGFPSRKLRVIGVTGTTGKTTTIHLIATALESAGYTVGAISSIHVQVGTKVEKNRSGLTSLGPWQLQKILAHMVRSGCHYAVIEVSSHALDQMRFWGTQFDVAVLTNLERDHIDYHRTLDDYAAAKRRLFHLVSRRPRKEIDGKIVPRVLVAPLHAEKTAAFLSESADLKYGTMFQNDTDHGGPDVRPVEAMNIRVLPTETHSMVKAGEEHALLWLKLPGEFNVRNALLAIAVGVSQGIECARITRELHDVRTVPGRFERVDLGQPFQVIVDYAVTEVALESLFATVRTTLKPKRVLAVFGACGNRDRPKRPLMAEIVGRNATIVFLTDEDPFTEDPEQIFSDLQKGLKNTPAEVRKIPDRREAIRAAVHAAQPGDVIVATGKGAEETMRFKDRTVPWSDRKVFEEEIEELLKTA
jgi:UDP-N-acetylmuramyl-tripeptide synthetase